MSSIAPSAVSIQTSPQSVPSTPSWFGEITIIAHYLTQLGLLDSIVQQVRFARRRFSHYETIDFLVVLMGYALSGEVTLEMFYDRLGPFASAFMALFGRRRLHPAPMRTTEFAPAQAVSLPQPICEQPTPVTYGPHCGHEPGRWADLQEMPSSHNPMGPCAAQLRTPSMHKNGVLNVMGACASSMLLVWAIVGSVTSENTV